MCTVHIEPLIDERHDRMTSLTPADGPAWDAIRISARWSIVRRAVEAGQLLKVAEGRLLLLLRDGEPRSLRQVADALDLEQSTVNRQVHAALASGVIVRSRPDDSPTYLVEMSDEGRARFAADMDRLMGIYGAAVATIPPAEQERFLEHLAGFVAALGERVAGDDQRPSPSVETA